MTDHPTMLETLARAARGVGKVDRDGLRGITMVSAREIEAMAMVLALLGLPQIPPGEEPEDLAAHFDGVWPPEQPL